MVKYSRKALQSFQVKALLLRYQLAFINFAKCTAKTVLYFTLFTISLMSCNETKKNTPTDKIISIYQEFVDELSSIRTVEKFKETKQKTDDKIYQTLVDNQNYKFSEEEKERLNKKQDEVNELSQNKYAELAYGETTHWMYSQSKDDLTGKVTAYNATVASLNEVSINDNSTTRLAICLKYSSLFNSTPSSAFMICFYDNDNEMAHFADFQGGGIRVIFDNGEVDNTWALMDNHSKNALTSYFDKAKIAQFINKLKQSKKCRIQVNIQNLGLKTFDFDVSGLKWDY